MSINGVIQRKFALLDEFAIKLEASLDGVPLDQFKQDWVLQRMTERSLQVMIEIVIDIAERLLALENKGPAATAAEALNKLAILGVLKSSQPYGDMVRFRNLIVHQYEEIEPKILYDLAVNKINDFRKFREEIDRL
jgi:uncharacterized protein YutE (UPF0331/DUF86 family)